MHDFTKKFTFNFGIDHVLLTVWSTLNTYLDICYLYNTLVATVQICGIGISAVFNAISTIPLYRRMVLPNIAAITIIL